MTRYKVGDRVRLTDHRVNEEFREDYYEGYDPEWKRFWDEYVDRTMVIKAIDIKKDNGQYIYLENLPSYVDNSIGFPTHEIRKAPAELPEDLFTL